MIIGAVGNPLNSKAQIRRLLIPLFIGPYPKPNTVRADEPIFPMNQTALPSPIQA